VRSGDPENVEAQAARRYWRIMFGGEFSRDRQAEGINALLNYGYTVLRAVASRAICAAGLHPTIGIFHANRANAFALADDVMEPFRPMVDLLVRDLVAGGENAVTPDTKVQLARVGSTDVDMPDGTVSPLDIAVQKLVHSLSTSFETGKPALELPVGPATVVAVDTDIDA
jgi:CRISPR-associated protein Cas1